MITRIVRMQLQPDAVSQFQQLFDFSVPKIRSFSGCLSVALFIDTNDKNAVVTVSNWISEAALEEYRSSELFISTWRKVKPLFREKAIATTLLKIS